MIIRPVEARDRAAWDELYAGYAAYYGVDQTDHMRDEVWAWLMDDAHDVSGLVADHEQGLIGLAHVRPFSRPLAAATGLFLDDLFVAPSARGTGAGAALLKAVRDRAAQDGHVIVRWITAQDNSRARTLYDKVADATTWVTYDMPVS